MIIQFLNNMNAFNELCMNFILKFVHIFNVPEFLEEAIAESINLIPFLFVIFVFIEIFENYFSEKIENLSLGSRFYGPLIGSCLASIPQCGFSIIATILYIKKFISLGTLLAVYIATSDEAIPILLAEPNNISTIVPVICTKVVLGLVVGYAVDLIFKPEIKTTKDEVEEIEEIEMHEEGCCHSEIHSTVTKLFIHPLKHTFNIFLFILVINCLLSTALTYANETVNLIFDTNQFVQVFLASIIGLIPNCATSVLIVMLYLKNVIGFGSLIAGLSTNAGLGLLVLFKHNDKIKDSLKVVGILFVVAIFAGLILQIM